MAGIWQPSYASSIPARLFERLFGTGPPMEMTMEEGSDGQLYWEARERTAPCHPREHAMEQLAELPPRLERLAGRERQLGPPVGAAEWVHARSRRIW